MKNYLSENIHSNARTKIICTMGPTSSSTDKIQEMINAGMDAVRLNFSHNSHQWHKKMFKKVRAINDEITIIFDLQGPKIRLGELKEPQFLVRGETITLTTEEIIGDNKRVTVGLKNLPDTVQKGDLIYINDGIVGLEVKKIEDQDIKCEILSSGEIRSKKGVNVPNVDLNVPSLTKKDHNDLDFALQFEPDYIALSFVRSHKAILKLREIITDANQKIPIISKIEHAFAVKNFDKIVKETNAVMVACGDLGIETSVSRLPILQKRIIEKCNRLGKPVITATQMLESMVQHPRPTRAEASDVANAIYDGSDAVMLSAETAIGKYPVEAIRMMNEISRNVEKELHWKEFPDEIYSEENVIAENLATAAGLLVHKIPVKAIFAFTEGGFSARLIAKHRPKTNILVVSHNKKIIRQLGIIWGSYPIFVDEYLNTDQMVVESVDIAKKRKYISNEDTIVIVSGSILSPGKTNLLRAYKVNEIPSPEQFEAIS